MASCWYSCQERSPKCLKNHLFSAGAPSGPCTPSGPRRPPGPQPVSFFQELHPWKSTCDIEMYFASILLFQVSPSPHKRKNVCLVSLPSWLRQSMKKLSIDQETRAVTKFYYVACSFTECLCDVSHLAVMCPYRHEGTVSKWRTAMKICSKKYIWWWRKCNSWANVAVGASPVSSFTLPLPEYSTQMAVGYSDEEVHTIRLVQFLCVLGTCFV